MIRCPVAVLLVWVDAQTRWEPCETGISRTPLRSSCVVPSGISAEASFSDGRDVRCDV